MQTSARYQRIRPYFFADLPRRIAAAEARGLKVIRLDMGSPDLPPPAEVVERLVREVRDPSSHGYTPYGGPLAFREAAAAFFERRFGVAVHPEREVLGLIGSKEGLFHLSQIVLDDGDLAMVPDPGYPTYGRGTILAGGQIHPVPLLPEHDDLIDLEAIPEHVLERAKVLWLNYPNNPTGAVAPLDFFHRAVEYAHQYRFLLVHDAAYTEVGLGDYQAPSLLQIPGARQVAVEFHSLSKSFNMAGWRVGMAIGQEQVVAALHRYKTQVDSSHFQPIWMASIEALQMSAEWIRARNAIYTERRDRAVSGLRTAGLTPKIPRASLYVWAALPPGEDGMRFCTTLLEETGVSLTPGVVFGLHGEGFIRLSLATPVERIELAMNRLHSWKRIKV